MDAILDRMPANNPPPRVVLACTSSTYMFIQPRNCTDNAQLVCVWVLHIKPFFQPVDIQLTQCPCRFFLLERYKLCGHKTTAQRYYLVHCTALSRVDHAMTRHCTGYDIYIQKLAIHMLWQRKTKGTTKLRRRMMMIKMMIIIIQNNKKRDSIPPWDDRTKQYEYSNINRIRPRAKGQDRKTEAQQNHFRGSHSSNWVCGTSSIRTCLLGRFYLSSRSGTLVSCLSSPSCFRQPTEVSVRPLPPLLLIPLDHP